MSDKIEDGVLTFGSNAEIEAYKSYPPLLQKACADHYTYYVLCKDWRFFQVSQAYPLVPGWVGLLMDNDPSPMKGDTEGLASQTYLEIQVSEISEIRSSPDSSGQPDQHR